MLSFFAWVLVAVTLLALLFGIILGISAIKFKVDADPMVEKIDALLPQSQCAQCGYPGCKPYAQAIVDGEAITKCIPGGKPLVEKLADLLGVDVPDTHFDEDPIPKIAFIDESMCIGCTKCIQACPVDAIIGTNRALHTVIPDLCTGCALCLPPCPTDCIAMINLEQTTDNWNWKFDPNLIITTTTPDLTHFQGDRK